MSNPDSAFFVFDTHAAAEDAIRTLGQSGFDMKKLSLVGKGYHSEEKPWASTRPVIASRPEAAACRHSVPR